MSRFFLPLTLLTLLTLQPSWCWAAEADPRIGEAEERIEAWRLAEAQEIVAALLRENPRSAEALDLSARVNFYHGRYEEALKLYEQALVIDAKNDGRQRQRLFAQQTLDTLKKFKRFESEHFIVYLDEERDGILLPYVLDTLEKSYRSIGRALGYSPASKVRVEIAPDAASFKAISTLSLRDIEETGAVGICKFNKIMTISPRVLLQGYRWLDSLSHEYLHHAIVPLSDNKAPIWLHEGMARFYETLWRRAEAAKMREDYLSPANRTLLAQALEKDKFVGFKKMEPSLIYLETPEQVQLAYAEAASAIDFFVERKGEAGVRELLAELRSKPTPEAIEKVVGLPFAAFETEWKRFLKAKGFKEIEGARVRRFKVKENQKGDEESVELREIQSVVARNRTHLADQMLERGRSAAAVQEYQRALQASPHSPIILNKLARLLIQQTKYQEALPLLQRAQELDPDSGGTLVQLGRLYHGMKNFSAGKAALEEAIQINPFNPEIYRLLHDIYSALGDEAQAKNARANLERLRRMR